ncbi:pyridoxal phosphate-dependent aminotransferase [Maribius pontilimi]|uniref:histidinol-phosphate transaminase n=1 Tax=Palleronia pontilimi TaxID=1964209 RepID=A0A934IF95_9RHOB|nr:pyridoxal phosphate-dependent aminotransferase [Palleronia pontilimi]MBJ3761803.1 pyridoxal phosphate-dependent aminotransferase [Palleronia pontilimi]
MSDPRLTPLAAALPDTVPFVGPETQERRAGGAFRARLGANELTFGPSPKAIAAIKRAAHDVWKYPDPEYFDLKQALASHLSCDPVHIVTGAGIDGLLGSTVRLLVAPGDAVVTSDGAYPTFNYHVTGYGGTLHKVPYAGNHEDLDALLDKAVETRAKLIYLSNPDNPMGSWHTSSDISAFIDRIPDTCVLVLDEAYAECSDADTTPPLQPDHPNVIRFRTFSKAYGMAGARIGYAIGPQSLIGAFGKVRNHFGVSRISAAGAIAALADTDHLNDVLKKIAQSVDRIFEIARANDLAPLPTATNFVTIDCGRDGDFARAVLQSLGERGVFIRMPGAAPLDRCIRVTCGPDDAMNVFAQALPVALETARTKK